MILGGLPRLHLDRTGVALLGAIAIVGAGVLTPEEAAQSIHLPTILLLFSFMVISAQMRLGGFYARSDAPHGRAAAVAGGAAGRGDRGGGGAVGGVHQRHRLPGDGAGAGRRLPAPRLDPVPFLLALACASNIGSAATLIGNPQNMLIGEVLKPALRPLHACRRCRRCWPACCCCGC
jgi:hypothetical protein